MSTIVCNDPSANPTTNQSINPDTLPSPYTAEQLNDFIFRQLGSPQWTIELTKQQVYDAISIAFNYYCMYRPRLRYGSVRLIRNVVQYMKGQDIGVVVNVDFVDTLPTPTEIFYGNLISPAPLLRTGLDEYASFLNWRRTWQRVTSVLPDWLYDDIVKVLYIHNPVERYHCGITAHQRYKDTSQLDFIGQNWVREYSLARSRYIYGEFLAKFGNAIPAPLKDLSLDNQKRQEANKQMDDLLTQLKGMQVTTPVQCD